MYSQVARSVGVIPLSVTVGEKAGVFNHTIKSEEKV